MEMEMENDELAQVCKSCGLSGTGDYCSRCGLPYKAKRISMAGLLHDIFHLFTHLDKGFGYTVKMLITAPGHMQREYIEGQRAKHQKPFSMFLICATVAALSRYWIFQILIKYYDTGNISEANFFHEYMVTFFIAILPLHALMIYLLFYKSGYNYAEIGVLVLYFMSLLFLVVTCIALLKFIWPEMDTMYVEFPILLVYNTLTFINFFHRQPRWIVVFKSVVLIIVFFYLEQISEDFVVDFISKSH